MKKIFFLNATVLFLFLTGFTSGFQNLQTGIPKSGNNKVAYYAFDSGGPDHYPITSFTDKANVVVLFEGSVWELADTVDYANGYIISVNSNYHYYSEILRDIKTLQARGVKVLMNVDDAPSWSTATPFTTYDSVKLDYKQFAKFIKACAIDSLHLDGISLDIEHRATGNANYIALLKEIGKYFGPRSQDSAYEMYTAAIYAGYWGQPASAIGKSKVVSSYFNFVMDMAYFNSDYVGRFNQWADSIGASKTMIGVLNDDNNLNFATKVAEWQPANPPKAGIMVYAANNLKSYTDSVFSSLVVPVTQVADNKSKIPHEPVLMQNYPNPFNPTTTIRFQISQRGMVTLKVYDILGNEIKTLINKDMNHGYYSMKFDGTQYASGLYIARLTAISNGSVPYLKTIKMLLVK